MRKKKIKGVSTREAADSLGIPIKTFGDLKRRGRLDGAIISEAPKGDHKGDVWDLAKLKEIRKKNVRPYIQGGEDLEELKKKDLLKSIALKEERTQILKISKEEKRGKLIVIEMLFFMFQDFYLRCLGSFKQGHKVLLNEICKEAEADIVLRGKFKSAIDRCLASCLEEIPREEKDQLKYWKKFKYARKNRES